MDELLKMGKEAGINKLAELEAKGILADYIAKIAPKYVDNDGNVMKFNLITDLGW